MQCKNVKAKDSRAGHVDFVFSVDVLELERRIVSETVWGAVPSTLSHILSSGRYKDVMNQRARHDMRVGIVPGSFLASWSLSWTTGLRREITRQLTPQAA